MRVAYVCQNPGEADYDLLMSCLEDCIQIKMHALDNGWYFDTCPGLNPNNFSIIDKQDIYNIDADLIVLRYAQADWPLPKNLNRTVYWASEQGPTRDYAVSCAERFDKVAVNNKLDVEYYKTKFPGKRVFYLPFGGRRTVYKRDPEPIYDIICTTTPHYACGCEGELKRQSFDVMIKPLLNYNVSLWGMEKSVHGWESVPNIGDKYKGNFNHWEYQNYLAKSRLYVDTTFNWKNGGFGCKLGRALATGIPIIWQKTLGMELEFGDKEWPIVTSENLESTRFLVTFYLQDSISRKFLSDSGYEWFLKNWVWSDNIKRLAEEV